MCTELRHSTSTVKLTLVDKYKTLAVNLRSVQIKESKKHGKITKTKLRLFRFEP